METWGFMSKSLEDFLVEMNALAVQKQRDRGVLPTRWLMRWRTVISMSVTLHVARALLDSLPAWSKVDYCCRAISLDDAANAGQNDLGDG